MTEPPPSVEDLRDAVRARYSAIARGSSGCCSGSEWERGGDHPCCAPSSSGPNVSGLGYTSTELSGIPSGANLGLGCGNPTALGALRPGEVVLDLGSGGGIDCFLAAQRVGANGQVIGVDMTAEMVGRARALAARAGVPNVEFRLGEIEHLPVADASVDVVLSNCVINLVPDVGQVYREAFRVLRPGGRLAVSDVVALGKIPESAQQDPDQWASCSSGARSPEEVAATLRAAGFVEIRVGPSSSPGVAPTPLPSPAEFEVVAGSVRAVKPSSA
jgi:arsenite methyltransferase